MTVVIPTWVFWVIGIVVGGPLLIAILFFAWLGFMLWWNFKDGIM